RRDVAHRQYRRLAAADIVFVGDVETDGIVPAVNVGNGKAGHLLRSRNGAEFVGNGLPFSVHDLPLLIVRAGGRVVAVPEAAGGRPDSPFRLRCRRGADGDLHRNVVQQIEGDGVAAAGRTGDDLVATSAAIGRHRATRHAVAVDGGLGHRRARAGPGRRRGE